MGKIQKPVEEKEVETNAAMTDGDDSFLSDNPVKPNINAETNQTVSIDKGHATNEVYEPLSHLRHDTN